MKKIGEKLVFVLGLVFFLSSIGFASAELKKADELFEKGAFEAALKEYEAVFKEAKDDETRWKAFYRSCESLTHLFRYGEAAEKLSSLSLPEEKSYQLRILILKAELFRNFLKQYAYFQRRDVIDEGKKEVFRLTPKEVREEIEKDYQQLFVRQKELLNRPLADEGYFLEIKDADFGMYPTLFDYLILSWTDFLLNETDSTSEVESVKPPAEQLLGEEFRRPVNFKDPSGLLAAELIEQAGQLNFQNRQEAAERWKIKRLLLPLKYSYRFEFKDLVNYRQRAQEILLKWLEKFKTKEARAEAGYEAALIYSQDNNPAAAVKLCEKIEKSFSGTFAARQAERLRNSIQMPQLNLQAKTVMPPAQGALTITTKNLKKVYFQIYRIDPEQLKESYTKYRKNFYGWTNILVYPERDWFDQWLKEYLVWKFADQKWETKTEDQGDYKTLSKIFDPPALSAGIYLVLACADRSFKPGSSLLQACFLNVTDLVLVGTPGVTTKTFAAYYDLIDRQGPNEITDDGFQFYTLAAKTGQPVGQTELNIYSPHLPEHFTNLRANELGRAALSLPIYLYPRSRNYWDVYPLAKSNHSFAYCRNPQYLNYDPPNPIQLFLETDRPIYRHGQTVKVKVIVVRKISQGFKTLDNTRTVNITANDPNYKEFFRQTVQLNGFGSASVNLEIPSGRLLGRYTLNADSSDGQFSGNSEIYFSVEEYKRPEFEISLKPAEKVWKYAQPVEIKGSAKYYFGGPVPSAVIKYRIKRQSYIPWCYRYWFAEGYAGGQQEVANGELKTDPEGNFTIPFTPTAPQAVYRGNIPDISRFLVEVDGRDAGGRTIQTQQTYQAGRQAIYFDLQPRKGFSLEKEKIEIATKLLTINDTPLAGKAGYQVFVLADQPAKPLEEQHYQDQGIWVPPLDLQLKDVPNAELVEEGEIKYGSAGESTVVLRPLPQGVYRIVLKAKDQWGEEVEQNKIFVVAKSAKEAIPLRAASVTLVEKDEYQVGQTARLIIGSGLAAGRYWLEIWAGEYFLRSEFINRNQPVQLIEIPVTEALKGGFTVRWFGVKDLEVYSGQTVVAVPWKEKKLTLSLASFSKKLKPGEKVAWGVRVKNFAGQPQKAELLALMYDRSLEYYLTSQNPWLDSLYTLKPQPGNYQNSVFDPQIIGIPITEGLLEKILKTFRQPPEGPRMPGLRTRRTWAQGYDSFDACGGYTRQPSCVPFGGMLEERAKGESLKSIALPVVSDVTAAGEAVSKVEARKEFADTAFFKPQISTALDGRAKFSFTAPEQLTSWRIKMFAFTKDIQEGTLVEEAQTQKELMVRADLPRFFREKDQGTVTAIVHNESDVLQEGELIIEISENKKMINDKLKLTDNRKLFKIKPHQLASFNWLVEIPSGVSTYKVRVVAISKNLSDAEERELPILPSRQRLVESAFVTLSGNTSQKLAIALKADPTRINEAMTLQIDPQLALSILNTIPFLIEYPYNCVEQLLNKYVPLSIVNELYKKYPNIQKAVKKIPKRQTVTPAWEKDDPRRLISLMETPWVWQSEGRPTVWPLIDLLDPQIVESQKNTTLDKLRSAQLSNGAFPWWPGGVADPYITLYVLAGLSEARRYGVEVPKEMIQRALGYVNQEIPRRLTAEEYNLSLVSYAGYVLTSFSAQEFSAARDGHTAAKSWVVFLERHIYAMTPLGKAYLAYTYLRLGDKEKANKILDLALDGAREDSVTGVYWTPEKYSWVWYADTVEKHAFFLRALQELRPADKRIPGMVRWLLFSRKGSVWKSTKASVSAVFSLLDYLNRQGALTGEENFNIKWGDRTDSVVVKADDWLDKPLRWQEKGFEITTDKQSATVEKKGPGVAFASLNWIYSTDQLPQASAPGLLELKRTFYRRVKEGEDYHLKLLVSGDTIQVGDQIEVQLKINTRSQFEYMHLKDPKTAGFEAETLLSGWKYDPLSFYEEPRDSLTNFFLSRLPHGEYILRYRLRPTKPGLYRVGAATLQSMYSPEMTAHSAGFIIKVE